MSAIENVNDIFEDFAAWFVGERNGDREIIHPEQLKRDTLDYSVASLNSVDEYLQYLHEQQPDESREWVHAVLWGGAYVGEVIRRSASRQYDWVDFYAFIREYPGTTELLGNQKELAFCALLTAGGGGFTLPINKMIKFIHNGPEDSVHFYAACEVRDVPETS